MKTFGKLAAVLLAACMLSGAAAAAGPSTDNFKNIRSYSRGMFPDVDESLWYGDDGKQVIRKTYELGLMQGRGPGFGPDENLTVAEAVAVAARLRSVYEGDGCAFEQGFPWYGVYFDYAVDMGIVPPDFEEMAGIPCSREEMAFIFANALPAGALRPVNRIKNIPDVERDQMYGSEIYCLYNAGVLTGMDEYGSFCPYQDIKRCEAAAIISRLALPETRERFRTVPLNRWLKGYPNHSVVDYFVEVALSGEYEESSRQSVIKWDVPIKYCICGNPQDGDAEIVAAICSRLNGIKGFPGISRTYSETEANLEICFVSRDSFAEHAGRDSAGNVGFCTVTYFDPGRIAAGSVLISDELAVGIERDSVIYEECLQSLGLLNDSYMYPESIFYQDSNSQGVPAEIDWGLVELLYHPYMPIGAGPEQVRLEAVRCIEDLTDGEK